MINGNENVGNYILVSSGSTLQSVLRGRVIIITPSLDTVTEENNLCLCNLCIHAEQHRIVFSQTLRKVCTLRLLCWENVNETLPSHWHGHGTCWEHPPSLHLSHHPLHSNMISIWTFPTLFLGRITFLCILSLSCTLHFEVSVLFREACQCQWGFA